MKAVYTLSSQHNWGKGIVIEHSGFTTIYMHVNPVVNVGAYVNKGQKIGTIGSIEGDIHLHFGVRSGIYSDISKRGALPQKHGDSDHQDGRFTGCKSDPLFPEKFVDPMKLKYERASTITNKQKQEEILNMVNNHRGSIPPELVLAIIRQEGGEGAFYVNSWEKDNNYDDHGAWSQPKNGDGVMQVTSGSGHHHAYAHTQEGYDLSIKDGYDYLLENYNTYDTYVQAVLHYNTGPNSLYTYYTYLDKNEGDREYLSHVAMQLTNFVPNIYGLQNQNLVSALNRGQNILNDYLNDKEIKTGQSLGYYKHWQGRLERDLHGLTFKTNEHVKVIAENGWNMRSEPKLGDPYIKIPPSPLSKGSKGQILEHENNGIFADGHYWWYVKFGDYEGWCAEDGLEKSETAPKVAKPVLTSPLKITPEKDKYFVGDTLTAEFTITNMGTKTITFDKLTVGGQLNGECPDNKCPDFTFRSTTLQPNVPYQYTGTFTLTQSGNYQFFIAYYIENPTPEEKKLLDENNWNTCIDLGEGLTDENRIDDIVVLEETNQPPTPPDYFSEDWIEKVINWASKQESKDYWKEYCMAFVSDALKVCENRPSSPNELKSKLENADKYYSKENDWDPPKGSLVFFSGKGKELYERCGHIGISLGNKKVIHAYQTVKEESISDIEKLDCIDAYLGWAYPPESFFNQEDPSHRSHKFKKGDSIFKKEGWKLRAIPSCYGEIITDSTKISGEGEIIEDTTIDDTDINGICNGGECVPATITRCYWWYVKLGDYEGWCAEEGLEKFETFNEYDHDRDGIVRGDEGDLRMQYQAYHGFLSGEEYDHDKDGIIRGDVDDLRMQYYKYQGF